VTALGWCELEWLASAIAGRLLEVVAAAPGEPAWTDGKAIFLEAHTSLHTRIESLAVQASLLSAGSLEHDIVRGLARRPSLTRRYLAVEAHRALSTVEWLLPSSVRSLVRADVAALTVSPAASLAIARGRAASVEPPESFGTICPRRMLKALRRAERASLARSHTSQLQPAVMELADDAGSDTNAEDTFASPVGGGGAIGRWLSKTFSAVRQLNGGGSPGADAPTHATRAGARGRATELSNAATNTLEGAAAERGARGITYPEWDLHARGYRSDWCTVLETEPMPKHDIATPALPERTSLRRSLARLGLGFDRYDRQRQGDDIDIDALVAARVDIMAGSTPGDALFIDSLRQRRDLAVLLLLDISGSASEPAGHGLTVHDLQRSAAAALTLALHELGDRVALYAYHSQGRSAVHVMPVKRFGEEPGVHVMQRVQSLVPGAYSRLGAAIRHGTGLLRDHGGMPRRLLVVLSDGLAYDHGYEPAYGAADAGRALGEARRQGVGCLCLSVGASTDAQTLRRVFGASAHAALAAPEQLPHVIGPLFRSAIRSAEVKRFIH
jgi:hypothetical protein